LKRALYYNKLKEEYRGRLGMSRLSPLVLILVLLIILLNVACGDVSTSTKTAIVTPTITTTETLTTTTTQTLTTTTTTKNIEDLSSYYIYYIIITPKTATITAGSSQLYTVMGYDYEGNSFDVTRDCDFFITRGAGGTWVLNEYISENTGTWQIAADYWNPISGTEFWRDEATLIVKE
jgi:hypothetical protein